MIAPQSKSQICCIINSIRLANVRSNQQTFKSSPIKYKFFSEIRTLQVRAYAIHAKLSDKESFCHKISLKRGFRFDDDNWYVNNIRPFFPTEIEARRELARPGLISKHHYHPQTIQFVVLNNPLWQANIEAKQGRFQLDRYRPFAFQHGNRVYNSRDHERILSGKDNPWANCPGKNPEHEYLVIHTLGWSLQLNNITLSFDVKSESIYCGKTRFNAILKEATVLPITLLATVIWEPDNHCRIFDVGR